MNSIREDANSIIENALCAAQPDTAVRNALKEMALPERIILIAAGKAAHSMAQSAYGILGDRVSGGVVITKYGHAKGKIGNLRIFEAGHPISDGNSYRATEEAVSAVSGLNEEDSVLFLLSGGGSALFELPLIETEELSGLNSQMLACGADIVEINTVRKRLSAVKGGRFAQLCAPAQVYSLILSDVIGDSADIIASGPTAPDLTTSGQAIEIVRKYGLDISEKALSLLKKETPKKLWNVENHVIGGVRQLCRSAELTASKLGYEPIFLTAGLCCNARDAGSFLASIARDHQNTEHSLAYILGGETVVKIEGDGIGGRNQEIALAAAVGISGLRETAIFSVGSDGTDGPTDAAGGFVDQNTLDDLKEQGISAEDYLRNNDSYNALGRCGGLIMTGPTGTNVNDLTVLLIKR